MENPPPADTALDPWQLVASIKQQALALGFQQTAVSSLDMGNHRQHLDNWLQAGFAGSMSYMERHKLLRQWPAQLVDGARSAVCVRMDYLSDTAPIAQTLASPDTAYISRYALGRDYHKLMRQRLAKLAQAIEQLAGGSGRAFVDSAPVLERALAEQSGLGWIGKNCMLLNRHAGSWFFLGEIYTTLELPVDPPVSQHCGSCTACMVACPTQAFVGPYQLDARRCISYLTIELKESIPVELRPLMGNRVFGCDDCQLVCPWNRYAKFSLEDDFQPRHGLADSSLATLFLWTEEEFVARTAGSPIRRIGYQRWLRNLAVGLGNAPASAKTREALLSRQHDASELVREHVQWALAQQQERLDART